MSLRFAGQCFTSIFTPLCDSQTGVNVLLLLSSAQTIHLIHDIVKPTRHVLSSDSAYFNGIPMIIKKRLMCNCL